MTKRTIVFGSSLVLFLTLMMPMVHPLENQTVTQAREVYVEDLVDQDLAVFDQSLLNGKSLVSGSILLKILKIKWTLFIFFKISMIPMQLIIKRTVKRLVSPLKIILAPFSIVGRLLLYTLRFLSTPLRLVIMPILKPIILLAKLISIPFKIFDILLFVLFPFRHPLIDPYL